MEQGVLFKEAVMPKPVSVKTTGRLWLFQALLDGNFLMEYSSFSERYKHCLYNVAGARVTKVSKAQWRTVANGGQVGEEKETEIRNQVFP